MSLHKHRSRFITDGLARAPQRAFLRATGLDERDFDRSFVGIVTTAGENTPCSMSLAPQADQARLGVAAGGGVPVCFNTISVSDGTSMNHGGMRMSLLSRELIADSVELAVRAHGYDALIGFGGCDKTLPALMMAMVRLNLPSVFLYGGAMLPGRDSAGRDASILQVIEGVGRLPDRRHHVCRRACTPSSAAARHDRGIVRRASSPPTPWAWSAEALGLSFARVVDHGSGGLQPAPCAGAPHAGRRGDARCWTAGRPSAARAGHAARAWRMPAAAVAATGGSTNVGAAHSGHRARSGHPLHDGRPVSSRSSNARR
jgi:dihydroxy-acid dehydratase